MSVAGIPASSYGELTRAELAVLARELLLVGQLIDRSGMTWCLAEFGLEGMAGIAIEEWGCASPIYTRRMQRALGFAGDDVATIFKGLQLDIGAPHQFLDFRFSVRDARYGEFWLDHCGALADVAPMGPSYVRAMCHDIEDPTFDATAIATNRRAQIRPLFRPPFDEPRNGAVCHWTVTIDEAHPEAQDFTGLAAIGASRAAQVELSAIDGAQEGRQAYDGPVLSDVRFDDFSHSALLRIVDEFCLQMQLLDLSFVQAVRDRCTVDGELDRTTYQRILRQQLTGIAGVAASRIQAALSLGSDVPAALTVLRYLPMLNPRAYVHTEVEDSLMIAPCRADEDADGWVPLLRAGASEGWTSALDAAVHAVNPRFSVEVTPGEALRVRVVEGPARPVAEEVAVVGFSTGVAWSFEDRRALPLTPVST